MIAVNQDKLGRGGYRVAKEGDTEVWVKPLDKGEYAVALFNRGGAAAKVTARWSDLKLKGPHKVRDLWAHADRGTFPEGYSAQVPAHGTVLVKIGQAKGTDSQ